VVGTGALAVSERIEGMQRPTFALPAGTELATEPAADAGPRWVVARAEEELLARYGFLDDTELGLTPAMFDPPGGAFLVARAAQRPEPVGGVGLRRVGHGLGEVKRLWVDPNWRGRGLGRALMSALEQTARDLDLCGLCLATGDRQPEAIALYTSSGWEGRVEDADGTPLPPGYFRFAKRLT
jgi:GNAT superfamily N-acetyltransferase